ncbi:hypothetical protein TRIATDRAFT_260019 [Trichoderma atroviride IMI 206040]|uniref:Uncharacterized protein n=1 Tax=Hypocrea atroviridis (strain ATCC 20476 / IMI 206040) TaxID=452589 RepID=G9P9G7_HYPAI|nr:uncharacterized protein TRIATDRAFT_260019 [Trichoderma atroviride IMI 206040]EHK40290.1 hypothetical protein TRIATDRAFT_260019 [Trichoderma atroviride IMI 206040]
MKGKQGERAHISIDPLHQMICGRLHEASMVAALNTNMGVLPPVSTEWHSLQQAAPLRL